MQRIWNFVVTGGPCSGKSTSLELIKPYFEKMGFKVIVVPETATELIGSGIKFEEMPVFEFQEVVFERSVLKEETTKRLCKNYDKDVIIFYDRGLMDGKAYMDSGEDFNEILIQRNFTEEDVLSRYDAVFHLVTAADGAEAFYTLSNNKARTETPEKARIRDKNTYNAWSNHKKLYKFDNSTSFKTKIKRLLNQVDLEIKNSK